MKKTVLLVASAIMLMSTALVEANNNENNDSNVFTSWKGELTTFGKAILKGDYDTVKKLIDLGEDVNKKSLGMTPAIIAARYNRAKILELLIDNGADLNIRCDKGWSIKKYAKLSNAKAVLTILNAQA